MVSAGAKKTCYYELLGLDRKCEAAEIKATYRKLALRMHPDKAHQNGMCPEEATKRFQQIQEAYSVLSDAQERAWYDAHREQILRGDDGPGEDPFKTKINLYKYFSVSCFDGFGNDSRGFFAVYSELFEAIDAEEEQWEDADEDHLAMPPFGRADSEWADVSAFYRHWLDFCSRKAFGHADQWNPKDASNRQVRRAMEQENKKARQAAKKEFNAEVRQLVKFVQKRDPRYQAHQKQQMKENIEKNQRDRAEKDRRKADEAKEKEERKAAARQAEEERWAEARARKEEQRARGEVVSEDEEDGSEEELVEYFCEICKKSFKSEKAFEQHLKSKKHLQAVAKLQKELDRELKEEARASKKSEKEEQSEEEGSEEDAEGKIQQAVSQEPEPTKPSKPVHETADSETREDDSNSETRSDSEDDFLARFAAKQGGRGGYPQAATKTDQAASESEDEEQEDIRGRRAQKKEQQMAAALQRQQEKDSDQAGGKPRKKEGVEPSAKDGPIPEGNMCGVCGEDFSSRSAMFKHIKATGHAMLKPAVAEEPTKGKKKKR